MAFARESPHSFSEALRMAREILGRSDRLRLQGLVDAESEILVIAASGLSMSRSELYFRLADRYPEPAGEKLIVMSMARAAGKPLQHLTGWQEFLEHRYEVGPDVLIPRPETEVLVTEAIRALQLAGRDPALGLEIGIGSGVISVELLSAFPSLKMIASEVSPEAAALAARNADRILKESGKGSRLEIRLVDHPEEVMGAFSWGEEKLLADFLISNPPYLLPGSAEVDDEVARAEPHLALFAQGSDPSLFYRAIAREGRRCLKPGGFVFLELPHERSQEILEMFLSEDWSAKLLKDLNARERVLIAVHGKESSHG